MAIVNGKVFSTKQADSQQIITKKLRQTYIDSVVAILNQWRDDQIGFGLAIRLLDENTKQFEDRYND